MSNAPVPRRRGQPLLAMLLLMVGWTGFRIATWEPIAQQHAGDSVDAGSESADGNDDGTLQPIPGGMTHSLASRHRATRAATGQVPSPVEVEVAPRPQVSTSMPSLPAPPVAREMTDLSASPAPRPDSTQGISPPIRRVTHALLWMAAVSDLPLPPVSAARAAGIRPGSGSTGRWSADGWLLVRQDGGAPGLATSRPTYGGSQAGAVLRYRLAPSRAEPMAYLRATAALGSGERGLAAGVSLRPLAALPVRVQAEARLDRFADGRQASRAAVFAVSGLAPTKLPGGLRAEGYAQGGYVSGPNATGFVDGSLRVDHGLAKTSVHGEWRAGAGLWGGAQTGSGRLDIGPTVSLGTAHGTAAARLAVDWRFRVAGNAAPASGPAFTISAGF